MIPAAIHKYFSGANAYNNFDEISYPENWQTFLEHWEKYDEILQERIKDNTDFVSNYMNQNTYFFHCFPVVLGITQTHNGMRAFRGMKESIAGARDYGVSMRCKFMI